MKSLARNLTALTILFTTGHGAADVIYSGFRNITIPTTYAGTYIDVDGMTFSSSPITTPGWDFNPFMGGVYLSNSSTFQPARDGTGGMDTVLDFAAGTTISSSGLNFATGSGGSMDHLGTSSALLPLFPATHEGYLGFTLGGNYGWMRVVFTNNAADAKVLDWAYDTSGSGGAIATGNILSDGSTVTLDSTHGSYTLSALSPIGGSNNVAKNGAGTVILAGANGYSGSTAVNVGTLLVNGSLTGSGTVTVGGNATLGGTGNISGAVTINGGGTLAPGASIESLATGALTLNTGSTFAYEINSSALPAVAADFQQVFGALALSGAVDLTLTDLAGSPSAFAANTTLSLINYSGSWNSGYFSYAGNTLADGQTFTAGLNTWKITYGATSGGLNFANEYNLAGHFVNLTSIPEPGSWVALGCLVGSGVFLRRRSR